MDQALSDGSVHAVITFGGPPETTACLLFHVEGDNWIAAVGGNEGVYPKGTEEDVMRFAREVRARALHSGTDCTTLCTSMCFAPCPIAPWVQPTRLLQGAGHGLGSGSDTTDTERTLCIAQCAASSAIGA